MVLAIQAVMCFGFQFAQNYKSGEGNRLNVKLVQSGYKQRSSTLFVVAGSLMLVNVVFLWIRLVSDFQLSILWAAIPAMIALATSIIGLFTLYPLIALETPWLARSGAGSALVAGVALCMAALWILGATLFGSGLSDPLAAGLMACIGVFIVAMVSAFICYAIAFLTASASGKLGFLLAVPVVSWGVILVVGMIKGLQVGLSLDYYTNAFIAAAFLAIGILLRRPPGKGQTGAENKRPASGQGS
ncbi:hypothetical protein [Microbulbifer spongiae]|uniref:Uncharacterized protein n=1 Tax=Microbulbifer spongiae TaxID=2944933 RepID=A0ABY9EAJ0_9GAMM|nr:hypothetical protein [Microbulbifer sp. MI-G]WKD48916.1 hypothetical protein M8T91_13570 [Microbulbifer sp. MI-G]